MLFRAMEGKNHIHIGKEPNYILYGQLDDMCKEVRESSIREIEKRERLDELNALACLCNRPRFDGCENIIKELDNLKHRYYPEYTYDR